MGRRSLAVAALVWMGALVGPWPAGLWLGLLVGCVLVVSVRRPLVFLLALTAGLSAGWWAADAERAVAASVVGAGPVETEVRVVTDPRQGRHGWRQVVEGLEGRLRGVELVVRTEERAVPRAGEVARLAGAVRPGVRFVRGRTVAAAVSEPRVFERVGAVSPLHDASNRVRDHLMDGLDPDRDPGRALLAGFLIGDTTRVAPDDIDALRLAGLSHFVAVSGSNVGLFLGLWWVLLAPVSIHPRLRAVAGLVGVVLFVVVTRAEPSVVRAGLMVGVVLGGRLAGLAIDAWTALAAAITLALLVSAGLATDVGFGLSVAATMGVVGGSAAFRFRPRWLAAAVGATTAAQLAVAPILLTVFGTVPLLAPLANVVASPLVGLATAAGGVGALLHIEPVTALGSAAARAVLAVAHRTAPGPQLGWLATLGLAVALAALVRFPSLRPAGVLIVVASMCWWTGIATVRPPAVVFLDVGQGDATLLRGDDFTALVDAGPDPVLLSRALRRYGVDRLDLVVLTHVHADHIEGMRAVVDRIPIGQVWFDFAGESTPSSEWLEMSLAATGITSLDPDPGTRIEVGGFEIEVLAPARRYAGANDQSVVMEVTLGEGSVLLTGDIERVAQAELDAPDVDVLKVPHHGGGTSDLRWLSATSPALAVIQVGENEYGHPDPDVVAVLEATGAEVIRTDHHGDVIVEVGPDASLTVR